MRISSCPVQDPIQFKSCYCRSAIVSHQTLLEHWIFDVVNLAWSKGAPAGAGSQGGRGRQALIRSWMWTTALSWTEEEEHQRVLEGKDLQIFSKFTSTIFNECLQCPGLPGTAGQTPRMFEIIHSFEKLTDGTGQWNFPAMKDNLTPESNQRNSRKFCIISILRTVLWL